MKTILTAAVAGCILAAGAAAQSNAKLKGAYILTEDGTGANGQPVTSIFRLDLAENGAVTGREATRANGEVALAEIQGTYTLNADSTGSLTLSSYFTDENGAGQNAPKNYALVVLPSGDISAIRVNTGFFTTGELAAAAAGTPAGAYSFRDRSAGRAARIAQVVLDNAGGVTGMQFVESVTGLSRQALKGSYETQANGFSTLVLASETTDENGDTAVVRETFLFAAAGEELFLIRTDNGPNGIFTMER